ncbi:MAG TPA: hypothetical protein VFV09_09505 [Actinomycetota bacterium]|nr:hypothetical protein [Actinomycetota bacterium]
MSMESRERTPVVTRVALAGLAAGAVGSSLLGPRILAGYAAVGLAVAVGLTLYTLGGGARALPALGAVLVMAYPLAAVERGEGGILWAAALTFFAMAGAYVMRGLGRDVVGSLAVGVAVVLHLGLLGSYLVLVAVSGNRLLGALVLMVVAFEAAHAVLLSRAHPLERPSNRGAAPASFFDPRAALAGLAACVVASVVARLFLDSPPGVLSSVVLGAAVGAAATLGHAAAAATSEDFESGALRMGGLDAGVFISLNALLFAAGAFYYGFRLYLA